ncbi:MAG: hypothetical protein JXI33_00145 [Candidatus Aminicenantes bacterium]|nr:hypothetical protein [Candidatus Aminicenantes bacterium]
MNHHEKMQQHFQRFHDGGVRRIVGWTFIGIVVAMFFALVFGLVVKALWNWIMPAIFGLAVITYWQAFGIIILSKILFSGIHPYHGHDPHRSPLIRHHRSYDRWWQEEGKTVFNSWLKARAGANSPESEVEK